MNAKPKVQSFDYQENLHASLGTEVLCDPFQQLPCIPLKVRCPLLCNFTSIGGKLYFISFVYDATSYTRVALLCNKDDAKEKLQAFLAILQPDQKVRTF